MSSSSPALENRGGAGGSPVLPNPAAKGSRRLRGKGKRAREARGVDSRPRLSPWRPGVARPQRPAAAGGGGPGSVIQRGGGGPEEGEEHHWASEVPKPTSIRVEEQWRGGSAVAGVRERRLWRMAALGCRGGGCGARAGDVVRRSGAGALYRRERRLGFAGTLRRPATGLMAVGLAWFCAGVNARRAGDATARPAALCFVNGASGKVR